MLDAILKIIAPLQRRIMLMVSRGVLSMVKDSLKMQEVQVTLLDGECSTMERIQNYGLSSNPPADSEVVAVFVGGNRDHGLVIACDNRTYRLIGQKKGEVSLYTDEGDCISLKRGNIIEVNSASKVVVNAPSVYLGGELAADGVVTGMCSCSYTGGPHPVKSIKVKAQL